MSEQTWTQREGGAQEPLQGQSELSLSESTPQVLKGFIIPGLRAEEGALL